MRNARRSVGLVQRTIVGVMVAWAMFAPMPAAAVPVSDLPPEELLIIDALHQRVVDINHFTTTQFKQLAWEKLADLVGQYIATSPDRDKAIANVLDDPALLNQPGFQQFLPASEAKAAADFQKFRELALEFKGTDKALFDECTKRGIGCVTWDAEKEQIIVSASGNLAEINLLFVAVHPFLDLKAVSFNNNVAQSQAAALQAVVAAIQNLERYQRLLAEAELLQSQEGWVKQILGVNAKELDALIEGQKQGVTESGEKLKNHVEIVNRAARAAFVAQLQALHDKIDGFYKQNELEIPKAVQRYQELFKKRWIDFPTGPSGTFIRLHLVPPRAADLKGAATLVAVDVSYCRPPVTQVLVTGTDADGNSKPAETIVEDIPLGIRVTGVKILPPGSPRPVSIHGNGRPQVDVDRAELQRAIVRLGVPDGFRISKVGATLRDFDDFDIQLNMKAPALTGLLADFDQQVQEIQLPLISLKQGKLDWQSALGAELDKAQLLFEKALIGKKVSVLTLKELIRVKTNDTEGLWSKGQFNYVAKIAVSELTGDAMGDLLEKKEQIIKLGVSLASNEQGDWAFHIDPHGAFSDLLDGLRSGISKKIAAELGALKPDLAKNLDKLSSFISVLAVENESDRGFDAILQFELDVKFDPKQKGAKIQKACKLKVDLVAGQVSFEGLGDFKDILKSSLDVLLVELTQNVSAAVEKSIVDAIDGLEVKLFESSAKLKVVEGREGGKPIVIDATGKLGGQDFVVKGIRLVAPKLEGTKVSLGAADFSGVKLEKPTMDELILSVTQSSPEFLKVSQARFTRDGLVARLTVVLEPLATEVEVGEVHLGLQDQGLKPINFKDMVKSAVVAKLKGREFELGGVGPVKELTADVIDGGDESKLAGLQIRLNGKLALKFFELPLSVPFKIVIAPHVGKIEIDPKEALGPLQELCQKFFSVGGVKIDKWSVIADGKYGIRFDFTAELMKVMTVSVKSIEVTTRGVTISPCISMTLPGFYPVGGVFVLVNPGVELRLAKVGDEPRSVSLLGDFTVASKGIENIVKIHGDIKAVLPPKLLESKGVIVLADILPLCQTKGTVDLSHKEAHMESGMVGPLAKLIDVKSSTLIKASDASFTQDASIRLLGLNIANTKMQVLGKEKLVRAEGQAKIPIFEAKFALVAEPNFSRMKASADAGFGIGKFDIGSAHTELEPGVATLGFGLLGVKLVLIAPGPTSLTPGNVLRLIESIFHFDISNFFNAIKNRKIVLNLLPSTTKKGDSDPRPPGQGDPSPGATTPPGSPESSPKPAGGQPAADYTKSTASGEPLPRAPLPPGSPQQRETPPEQDKAQSKIPPGVITYQPGNHTISFELDPKQPPNWLMIATDSGGHRWQQHFSISPAAKDHLTAANPQSMILVYFDTILPKKSPQTATCTNGIVHNWLPRAVTVNQKGETFVCDLFPNGTVHRIAVNWDTFGPRGLTKQNFLADLAKAENRLLAGDLQFLSEVAHAQLEGVDAPLPERLDAPKDGFDFKKYGFAEPLKFQEGYLFQRPPNKENQNGASVVYLSRQGSQVVFDDTSRLYQDARLNNTKELLAKAVWELAASAQCSNTRMTYLAGKAGGPLLFILTSGDTQLLVLIDTAGKQKYFRVREWKSDAYSLDFPAWGNEPNDQPDVTSKLLTMLADELWDEVYWPTTASGRRLTLLRGPVGKPTHFRILADPAKPGDKPAYLPDLKTEFDVVKLAGKYDKDWLKDKMLLVPPEKLKAGDADWTLWLINQLLPGDQSWPKTWTVEPRQFVDQENRDR